MQTVQWIEVAVTVIASTFGATGLIAIAAWNSKTLITHWLGRDLQRQKEAHEADLQATKLQHERELEAYRTSLIAAAEAVKAQQEVKKRVAVLVAEKEFEALQRLHLASRGNMRDFSAYWQEQRPVRQQWLDDISNRWDELGHALAGAELFLTLEDKRVVIQYRGLLLDMLREANDNAFKLPDKATVHSRIDKLAHAELAVDGAIREIFKRFRAMT